MECFQICYQKIRLLLKSGYLSFQDDVNAVMADSSRDRSSSILQNCYLVEIASLDIAFDFHQCFFDFTMRRHPSLHGLKH